MNRFNRIVTYYIDADGEEKTLSANDIIKQLIELIRYYESREMFRRASALRYLLSVMLKAKSNMVKDWRKK